MVKLLSIILVVTMLGVSTVVGEAYYYGDYVEVAFFQRPVCNGHQYNMNLKLNECARVPEWMTVSRWNLSIDPKGHCVKVYENPNCLESIAPAVGYSLSRPREDLVRERCRSTKLLGFPTVRSVKRVLCIY